MEIPFADNDLVIRDGEGHLHTVNLDPGRKVYGERLRDLDGTEYREWSPYRSKLSAYFTLNGRIMPFRRDSNVLYLGAASGTTASHVSDLVPDGTVYCVEFSPRSFRDLVRTCEHRRNMIPLLGDATDPDSFSFAVGDVDVVYQDVAQKTQSSILMRNMDAFSADEGIVCIKSRSEDVTASPSDVFRMSVNVLKERFNVEDSRTLDPYEKDHMMIAVRR